METTSGAGITKASPDLTPCNPGWFEKKKSSVHYRSAKTELSWFPFVFPAAGRGQRALKARAEERFK
jgi:hypothetical protein